MSLKLLFLKGFFLLLSAGCASVPEVPSAPERFALKGKVAVREGNEHFTANLLWHQRSDGFEIDLWGPLGQGRMQIVKKEAQIQIRDGRGELLTAGDPERVMRQQLGWALPLEVLPAWVQGRLLAEVGAEALTEDEAGRLQSFRQLDWQVRLERYQTVSGTAGSRDLPTRVTAENERTRLRLVVSEWEI